MTWILSAVFGLGLVYYRKKLSIFLFLTTLLAVPVLGELIVSLRRPIFYDRTLIWITIPLFLLLAAGIAQLKMRFLMIVMLGVLGNQLLYSPSATTIASGRKRIGARLPAMSQISSQRGICSCSTPTSSKSRSTIYFKDYEERLCHPGRETGVFPLDLFASGILEPKMTGRDIPRLLSLLHGQDRVWLVYSHNWYTDHWGYPANACIANENYPGARFLWGAGSFVWNSRS